MFNSFGHWVKDCNAKGNQQVNFANKVEETNVFFAHCRMATIEKASTIWYIDINTSFQGKVKMGNRNLVDTVGRGALVIKNKKGKRYIREMMLVLALDENLLSIGQMIEHMYLLLFGDSMVEIYDDKPLSNLVARVLMKDNKSFPLFLKHMDSIAMRTIVVESVWLWHRKIGHLKYQSLKNLKNQEPMYGLPEIDEVKEVCESYAIGKQLNH
ncbi:hypothetical protein FF1_038075 [Malus domestica]